MSRPRLGHEKGRSKHLGVRVTPEMHKALARRAKAARIGMSDYVVRLLAADLSVPENKPKASGRTADQS
jgi:predicted HicB family RNase H-like nuclease